jgi:putative phage-type endonuclease
MHPNVKRLLDLEFDEQRSEAWLKLRGNMLTASDAGTAIGVNKYETPDDLLRKKCGIGEKFTGNIYTEWGTKMEPVAIQMFEEEYGLKVYELGLIPHEKYPWLGGSPDGLTDTNCLVEIKCPMRRKIIPGEVPIWYNAQIQVCMEIMDVEKCYFVEYQPIEISWPKEAVFSVTIVPRDREWFAKYLPIMDTFWKRVLYFREHPDEIPMPKEKVKRPRKAKELPPPPVCEIQPISDEDMYVED